MQEKKTLLSLKRTALSCKRTLLSHFRTSLVCLSVAFAFIKLDKENPIDGFTITMIVLSALFLIAGVVEYIFYIKNLKKHKE